MHQQIDDLYNGNNKTSARFRWGLLGFDAVTILYFVVSSFFHYIHEMRWLEISIGIIYLLEFAARSYISKRRLRDIFHPVGLADLIVIASLLAPTLAANFSFLRIARALRLLRSYHVIKALRRQSSLVRANEEIIFSVVNLLVFIFVITAIVLVSQEGKNSSIANYVDALYFTVTTLTTTGFGDIILLGTDGRILAVLIMIFGISLFLRLIQTIFRPAKVKYACPTCGLNRHDSDAVHCKHCGEIVRIKTEGRL
ncbi:potassium channel family protein [Paraglaciecola arctica]|uniref:Cation channel family protein n=1 Tax=Paraglaciecola arctica BSs20135 TaxID=493475 RepID=K6XFC4_9ALTE|nr:potassium channel family protein [Paraglaciecola arctica]GAC19314.1 cation channel family protein [Paraglaciecola arctica BSs20135]